MKNYYIALFSGAMMSFCVFESSDSMWAAAAALWLVVMIQNFVEFIAKEGKK